MSQELFWATPAKLRQLADAVEALGGANVKATVDLTNNDLAFLRIEYSNRATTPGVQFRILDGWKLVRDTPQDAP